MSTPRLFGTDGIRAPFGAHPLDEATVRRLAAALGADLAEHRRPGVVLGGDTRDSTPVLCRWLAEGLAAHGAAVTYLGTVPTPAVAFAVRTSAAACGIAVSASHNRHPDNGIKLIDGEGFKWTPAAEVALEERMDLADPSRRREIGALEAEVSAVAGYLEELAASLPASGLSGLRVAVDAGHGAAALYAGRLFERCGARVVVTGAEPDGRNINAGCGSTHPEVVAALVRENGCDLGFAFDGDADRVVVADEAGEVRDGDAILYLWARDLGRRNRLPTKRIVATSMSNLGLEEALGRHGIGVVRCGVGDREVVAAMQREGITLGGEQSGHIVNLALGPQGDGLSTALHVARLRVEAGRPLSELLAGFERYPQLLHNVRVARKSDLKTLPRVVAARDAVAGTLGESGRLVLRYSGTEPLVRIMIEGRDRPQIERLAEELAAVLAEELG